MACAKRSFALECLLPLCCTCVPAILLHLCAHTPACRRRLELDGWGSLVGAPAGGGACFRACAQTQPGLSQAFATRPWRPVCAALRRPSPSALWLTDTDTQSVRNSEGQPLSSFCFNLFSPVRSTTYSSPTAGCRQSVTARLRSERRPCNTVSRSLLLRPGKSLE